MATATAAAVVVVAVELGGGGVFLVIAGLKQADPWRPRCTASVLLVCRLAWIVLSFSSSVCVCSPPRAAERGIHEGRL